MSFPRYSEYKDSGVEWLGKVPEHWDLRPLFTVMRERNESNAGMTEENLLSLSYGQIVQKDIRSQDGLLPESFETYQIVYPGDIVFRLTDLQNDQRSLRTAIVQDKGIITSAYVTAIPTRVLPAYANYLLRAYDLTKVFYSMGGGLRQSMKFSDLKRMPLLLPVFDEQLSIADFLDRETAKIDSLVAEQERLIALLKEKRQAVISHTITKGLDPTVPMKDSGVEWIGEVPGHWDVNKFRYSSIINEGQIDPCKEEYSGNILVAPDHIESGTGRLLEQVSAFMQGAISGKYRVTTGQIIYSKIRPALNKLCIAEGEWLCSADMYPISPKTGIRVRWLYYFMLSRFFVEFVSMTSQRVAMPKINRVELGSVPILLPPLGVQDEIITLLDNETDKIDALVIEAEQAIDLLKERRSALISAAVTGKIDVRGLVVEEMTA